MPEFNIDSPMGIIAILCIILYVIVKDVFPMMRRRSENGNGNLSHSLQAHPCVDAQELRGEIKALSATMEAQHEEQLRTNERFDRNFKTLFEHVEDVRKAAQRPIHQRDSENQQ